MSNTASSGHASKRQCTKCLVTKDVSEFYSKGKRVDSWCKLCKKKKRRASYIVGKNELNKRDLERLKSFVKMITAYEVVQLKKINEKIKVILESVHEEKQAEYLKSG